MKQRWCVTWIDQTGCERETTFTGPESRIAAGIDFKLLLLEKREAIPPHFELAESQNDTEETSILPAVPYSCRKII